jgi:hypothetical protein
MEVQRATGAAIVKAWKAHEQTAVADLKQALAALS